MILDAGFNQIFMLYSIPVYSVVDIIDTWVYRQGRLDFQFALRRQRAFSKASVEMVNGRLPRAFGQQRLL
jgi:putative aldouronate transport system permease protein